MQMHQGDRDPIIRNQDFDCYDYLEIIAIIAVTAAIFFGFSDKKDTDSGKVAVNPFSR